MGKFSHVSDFCQFCKFVILPIGFTQKLDCRILHSISLYLFSRPNLLHMFPFYFFFPFYIFLFSNLMKKFDSLVVDRG